MMNLIKIVLAIGLACGSFYYALAYSKIELPWQTCTPVVIVQVGGCTRSGFCAILYSQNSKTNESPSKGFVRLPVAGGTECLERISNSENFFK